MRVPDWPERLAARIDAARDVPFAWGSHDCALWACDLVKELTGIDPAEEFRGRYDSAIGAMRVVEEISPARERGFEGMVRLLAAQQGYAEIPPALAQRGDLVLCPSGIDAWPHALGVCAGMYAMMAGENGVVAVPMRLAAAAWRV